MESYFNPPSSFDSPQKPSMIYKNRTLFICLFYLTMTAIILSIMLLFCYVVKVIVKTEQDKITQMTMNFNSFLQSHNCERTGFAGQKPEAVYKCDNGIYLESEIVKVSSKQN